MSPGEWGEEELKKYFDVGAGPAYQSGKQVAVARRRGVVTGTSGVLATHIGVEALKQGGSAIDAAIATSMAQTTLTAGSAISFAGIFTLLYYDAEIGQVHSMNAAWNTIQNELDPMSIPGLDLSARQGDARAAILPDPTNPTIIFKDGKPYMGSSSIGSSLHHQTVTGAVLHAGIRHDSQRGGQLVRRSWGRDSGRDAISLVDAEFAPDVIEKLKAMGRQVSSTPRRSRFWLAAIIDPETGERVTTDAGVEDDKGKTRPFGLAEGH